VILGSLAGAGVVGLTHGGLEVFGARRFEIAKWFCEVENAVVYPEATSGGESGNNPAHPTRLDNPHTLRSVYESGIRPDGILASHNHLTGWSSDQIEPQ